MITFTIHEPPGAPADRLDRAESLAFVKDGFSVWAALFTPFWMVVHKLWIALAVYLSALTVLQLGFWSIGLGQRPIGYVLAALHLIIGYEADTIRRWTLDRQGWTTLGSVNGRNAEECERRFFDAWLPGQPYIRAKSLSQSALARQSEPVPLARGTPAASGGWRGAFPFVKRG